MCNLISKVFTYNYIFVRGSGLIHYVEEFTRFCEHLIMSVVLFKRFFVSLWML
jgi:hypothetical protein